MRILILGGTRFVGRTTAAEAVSAATTWSARRAASPVRSPTARRS
ncbi:hypothetical protein ACFQV2_37930 [Actinokineospora soli]|uniref:NAD dependent epimerase/dehydratase family protein n=1 Tax=Actinokineospora soli TaxID=1048753 RepID=A0ABW2TWK6_9PSEU